MKKILALFTALIMLVLCACSSEKAVDNSDKDDASEKQTQTENFDAKEKADENDSVEEAEEETEETDDEEEEYKDGAWKECYAEYLLNNMMELNAGAMYYEKGEGRFALKDMNGDKIPELFVIDTAGTSIVHKYDEENEETVVVQLADGGTDVVYLMFFDLMFGNDGTFIENTETEFSYWVVPENKDLDFALSFYATAYDGEYYCNEYDAERICTEGFEYRVNVPDNAVTAEEYEECIENYLYDEGEYSGNVDVYKITEDDIKAILG